MSGNYSELKKLWYQKLKESGFDDIEDPGGTHLKRWDSFYYQHHYTPLEFNSCQSYYYAAEHFLNSAAFKNSIDGRIEKEIWTLHSQGRTLRSIALLIQSRFDVLLIKDRYNKDNIAAIIKRFQSQMWKALSGERREQS